VWTKCVALPSLNGVGRLSVSVEIHGKRCCKRVFCGEQSLYKLAAVKHIKLPLVIIVLEEM